VHLLSLQDQQKLHAQADRDSCAVMMVHEALSMVYMPGLIAGSVKALNSPCYLTDAAACCTVVFNVRLHMFSDGNTYLKKLPRTQHVLRQQQLPWWHVSTLFAACPVMTRPGW
jgi:hypothetical protein